jgi:hypothetical protein
VVEGEISPLVEVVDSCRVSRRGFLLESDDSETADWRRLREPLLCCAGSGEGASGMRTADEIIVDSGTRPRLPAECRVVLSRLASDGRDGDRDVDDDRY